MIKLTLSLLSAAMFGWISAADAAEELLPKDLQNIESLQRRADKLASGELGANNYHLAKARTWLDMALSEYHQKDTSGLVYAATVQARGLLEALENKETNISLDMPKDLQGSEVVRTDLWNKIGTMKSHANFSCGQRQLAEAEVYLVWTGHEKIESGWTHAESYARSAENLIYEAQVNINNCAHAQPEQRNTEKFSLSGDAMFVFGGDRLTSGAAASLDRLAESIKGWTAIEAVNLVGHTDRLRSDGDEKKNQQLSEHRAERIKQYLVSKGIPADKVHTRGAGSSKPIVTCPKKLSKEAMVSCLQPNRRVEIILRGER